VTLKKKILWSVLLLLVLAAASVAIALSHDSPCGPAPALEPNTTRMQAIVRRCYGGPEVLRLEEVPKPVPTDEQILVKVHAASVNPADWHMMTGKPYLLRMSEGMGAPHSVKAGVDFAGTVEAVGAKVTRFKPGDAVFGGVDGAFAQYVAVRESGSVTHKPEEMSFEEAAALPIAAITALQALRDQGGVQPGQKVLINGASGGVGTYAVQIAKAFGAHVTGISSTKNLDLVRSLGADQVIDYTREDFTERPERYDLVIDNVGNHSFNTLRRVLVPKGMVVLVGGPKGAWVSPFYPILQGAVVKPFVDERFTFFIAKFKRADFELLAQLASEGKLRSAVSRVYPLSEVSAALEHLGGRHARGKLVIQIR